MVAPPQLFKSGVVLAGHRQAQIDHEQRVGLVHAMAICMANVTCKTNTFETICMANSWEVTE